MPEIKLVSYACPRCKRPLHSIVNGFQCSQCNQTYPITDGIPDFYSGYLGADHTPIMRAAAKFFDILSPVYESKLWERTFLNLVGAGNSSQNSITSFHSETLKDIYGAVLDVACGPATHTRRIASPSRSIYGIDISQGALLQGLKYVIRAGITGVQLARASVNVLPFENDVFDGVVCSGCLHLFPNTLLALVEIARTMKAGAPLSCQTFIAGGQSARLRSWYKSLGFKFFELPSLQQSLAEAGFGNFQSEQAGSCVTFRVHKSAACL